MKVLAFLFLTLNGLLVEAEVPVFSDNYITSGRVLLPYAEIDEPFKAYYTATNNKSRVDYYDELVQTVQRPDLGQFYKIAYMVNKQGDPNKVCFNVAASPIAPVTVQTVLPDLTNFQLKRTDVCRKMGEYAARVAGDCEEWEYKVTFGQKENKYVFILRRDPKNEPIPIYYLMMGYDSLLGSHYDKYEVIYETYSTGPIDPKVFDIYSRYTCRDFPGPGQANIALLNPIREFIHGEFDHNDQEFGKFSTKHNKTFQAEEANFRKTIFTHNYRFIMSQNRKNLSFRLGVNHLADRTSEELRALRGRKRSVGSNGGLAFEKASYDLNKVPSQWDWRLLGAVTPVKDQAICGSCWSFGTTGTIEGVYFVKTGNLPTLSQQQLIDCSWNQANNGCDGGEDFRSYEYIIKNGGISTEEDYGPYLGTDGRCHDKEVKKSVKLTGWYNVTQGDAQAMKVALYNHGPVTVAIDASQKSFSFYSHGVYYDPNCSSKDLDHQVLAVGYGDINGEKYWLIKNSWSTYWGNDGYVLISQKDNDCGVLTDATFPIVE